MDPCLNVIPECFNFCPIGGVGPRLPEIMFLPTECLDPLTSNGMDPCLNVIPECFNFYPSGRVGPRLPEIMFLHAL